MKRKTLHSSKWFLAFFTLLALFISCRKNETIGPDNELSKEELQKTFFNTATTNDTEIKKLAENIQKQKSLLKSLPEFARKNGIPKWDKVLYKTKQAGGGQQTVKSSSSSVKTNTVSGNGASQGVFFIPLQDENSKQVKSYITAYKHNDSLYTYRLYNKDSLNAIRPGSNTTKSNLLNTQAVFGYFEKTINNTDSVNVSSPTKATIKNVKINFDNPTNTNSVNGTGIKPMSGDGCLVAMSVSIEYTITIWSDGSYSEFVSVSMSIAFDCSGGGGGGSGDFGDGSTTYQTPNGGNYWWSYGTGWPYNTNGGGYNNNDPNYNYAGGPSGYFDPNWYWWWTNVNSSSNTNLFDGRTSYDYDTGDDDNNTVGGYDNTSYSDYDANTQPWPTVSNVIPVGNFIGWGYPGISKNCMSYCKAQIGVKGYQISDYGAANQTIQAYTAAGGANTTAAKNGVGYLLSALQRGIPVIVGVDDNPGSPNPNTDNTTDHFVVIVGSGTDSKGNYFTFYDNASGDPVQGTNPNNKLYYNPTTGLIKGRSQTNYASGLNDYIVTMIRKSK